ncbi:retrovirus-related pol polyprotein from transposon TNT 1-94 [Tanacetum coccineum]|uniref:Retrovirus-related pol polyprotein from transposon TNT 1-94 n=1 Tax=Tanacetum coccineum TaxID=301880 RepID=A0ABQ5J6N7_9ASTR
MARSGMDLKMAKTCYHSHYMFLDFGTGLKWKPTGRLFTIVGNSCPLTRITPKKIVHLKETTSKLVETPKPEIKVYSRRPKQVKSIDVPSSSSLVNERVYYVEGLGHNLYSVGQFCDVDLEVAFQKNTCFIRNLEGVDLLLGSKDANLYTISLDDMLKTSPICLLSKASKIKNWLWHRRLSRLNFGTLNKLPEDSLARGIPKLKFQKDHLCSACALGKSKKSFHQPKAEDTNQVKLYLLHMDLCGQMRVGSINGKKYILVIGDDYSRFTWVNFLRSKDEAPNAIIKCIKNIQVRLNATVRNVRTDNGTEFVNQTLRDFYENLMQDKKSDLSFLHVFGSFCYPTNDSEDLGKINAKADIGILVGYAPAKKAFRINNRRTRKIMETIHVMFDELITLAFEQFSSGPRLQSMTPATSSSGLVPNPIP